jgi:hypothetical protein
MERGANGRKTMARFVALTNLIFAYLVLLLLLAFGLFVVFYPFNSGAKVMGFVALVFASNVVGAFVVAVIQTKLLTKESIWLQPVSEQAGVLLINSLVLLWLSGVGFIAYVILRTTQSTAVQAGIVLALLAGAGLGRHLQRRYWPRSWVGYAVGSLGALLVLLAGGAVSVLFRP